MAAKTHNGTALNSLVEQPGARFTLTRAGFDTGTRRFKCWAEVVESLIPEKGAEDSVFPGMKVDAVNITFDAAGVATMDVSYLGTLQALEGGGQLTPKPEEFRYATDYQEAGSNIVYVVDGVSRSLDFGYHLPQVTHTYLSESEPIHKPGAIIDPLMYADRVPDGIISIPALGIVITPSAVTAFWRLNGQEIRRSGDLYEIVETYNYTFKPTSYSISYS